MNKREYLGIWVSALLTILVSVIFVGAGDALLGAPGAILGAIVFIAVLFAIGYAAVVR